VPSRTQWGAGDPDGTKLTDGIAGPPYPGGTAPASALCWDKGQKPEITVDLGQAARCGAFRIQLGAGWPWWDALKGQVKDKVEVLTSCDGQEYRSQGCFNLNLRWKDLPANHFWPDEEIITAHLFELVLPSPVEARYVRFKVTPERTLTVSEVEALDFIKYELFDLRVALPDEPVL
ncbi:MAG TPA: discoidin domain-containing protein, partial [Candidatus Sulfotelmatobacter sp.]|nr:discoidin domain-containing protein [Candidatus Sulfotelmatobacter sp.]